MLKYQKVVMRMKERLISLTSFQFICYHSRVLFKVIDYAVDPSPTYEPLKCEDSLISLIINIDLINQMCPTGTVYSENSAVLRFFDSVFSPVLENIVSKMTYRPICKLTFLLKVSEKLVSTQLIHFFLEIQIWV